MTPVNSMDRNLQILMIFFLLNHTYENVGEQVGEPCFSNVSDNILGVPVCDSSLLVGKALDMKGRVREDGVHKGQTKYARD